MRNGVECECELVAERIFCFALYVKFPVVCLEMGGAICEPEEVSVAVGHSHVHDVVGQCAVYVSRTACWPMHFLVVGAVVTYAQVKSGNAVGGLCIDALCERRVYCARQSIECIAFDAVAITRHASGARKPDVRPHEVGNVATLGGFKSPYAVQVFVGRVCADGQHGVFLQKLIGIH